jgi:hypothetical protein
MTKNILSLPQDAQQPSDVEEAEPKSVLLLLGKKAVPEEREALLMIGINLLNELSLSPQRM